METNLTIVIGTVGTICGILFGYIGYQRGLRKDIDEGSVKKGSIFTDIEYIKKRIDDVLLEQKDTTKVINTLLERVIRVEEMSKSAHKRIDEIEKDCRDCKRER
jgi:hypothetical protein